MGLGQYLVHELDFEEGVNTLGRWMAHYLAELINEAENGSTVAKRTRARKEAAVTILKIWNHRMSLPGRAYPLSPYMDLLRKIDRLHLNNNPFRYIGQDTANKKGVFAVELFDGLSRLIISLLLMDTDFREESEEINPVAIAAMDETEQRLLTALQNWADLFESSEDSLGPKRTSKNITKIDLGKAALRLIDSISTNLEELRSELQGINGDKSER